MKPETNDPRPAYLQVADELRDSIDSGGLKPGERLPSGRDLARRYSVAPMTVSHALDVLRGEGLVEAYQGRGVFVTDHRAPGGRSRASGRQDPAISSLRKDLDHLAARVARMNRASRRQDPAISSLREDLDQLAKRVARIEQILTDGSRTEADPP